MHPLLCVSPWVVCHAHSVMLHSTHTCAPSLPASHACTHARTQPRLRSAPTSGGSSLPPGLSLRDSFSSSSNTVPPVPQFMNAGTNGSWAGWNSTASLYSSRTSAVCLCLNCVFVIPHTHALARAHTHTKTRKHARSLAHSCVFSLNDIFLRTQRCGDDDAKSTRGDDDTRRCDLVRTHRACAYERDITLFSN